jgi:putative heme degradation protein
MNRIKSKVFGLMVFLSLNCLNNAFGQEIQLLEGSWTTVPSTALAMQFFLNDGEVSAAIMIFSGNTCTIGIMQGTMGLGTTKQWEGTFRVNTANKTLTLIDDFDDEEIYRYVLSEAEEDMVLKLKSSDGEITTWYKSK